MTVEFANFIGGRWASAVEGNVFEVSDPANGQVYATSPDSDGADVDAACAAAGEAFAGWRRTTPSERQRKLLEVAELLEDHCEDLARLEVADTGKPWNMTRTEEIPQSIDHLRFFAGAARMLEGRATTEYSEGVTSGIRREPVGICAQITPWNYPLMMAVWKWAPAVAAGNTVVLKPSEHTPASTLRMAELAASVLPPGVLNVICGGPSTGELLARHRSVAMISITGSPRAGRQVATAAADRLARVHLELGGNAPVLVFADSEVPEAAASIASCGYYNGGQDCTAASRVLVERAVYEAFCTELVARAEETVTGAPFEPDVYYGPLVSDSHLTRVSGLIERLGPHAKLATGGQRVDRAGWFFAPTVITGVHQRDEIVQTEVFGPVITVQPFDSESEALRLANDVVYGLTASVWTCDHGRAQRFCRDLDFGAVSVNVHGPVAGEMPHGGFGASGYGKDLAIYGLEDYTRIKHVAHAL